MLQDGKVINKQLLGTRVTEIITRLIQDDDYAIIYGREEFV